MYPIIHIVLPSYSVLAVIGLFISMIFIFLRIDKYKLPFTDFLKMFALCLITGFLGSKIVFFFSRIPWLIENFSIPHLLSSIFNGGFVFYGGLIGVLYGVHLYCKKREFDKRSIYDMIAPAIPLFHAFGRIGCFMAGCCFGKDLVTPIVLFNSLSINKVPVQLIEAFFELILFIVICSLQKKKPQVNHLKIYMITYAIFRFIMEFSRGDAVRGMFFGVSTSQIISLLILLFYTINGIKNHNKNRAIKA